MTKSKVVVFGSYVVDDYMTQFYADEIVSLVQSLDLEIVAFVSQKRSDRGKRSFVGTGKLQEIKLIADENEAELVIFNHCLSSRQILLYESILKKTIFDRTFVILQIFAQHAKTTQAMLEVSLAQKLYLLPRLGGKYLYEYLSRQGGGFQAKGPGETKLETDKRTLEHEIFLIKERLQKVDRQRHNSSKRRSSQGLFQVALVGYTNAGKSSTFNSLTNALLSNKEDVLAKDALFATLDTKYKVMRRMHDVPFILADTVGFVSNLPMELLEGFKSTLASLADANLIIEVRDGSLGSHYKAMQQHVVNQVLTSLGLPDIPRIVVNTKADILIEPRDRIGENIAAHYFNCEPDELTFIEGDDLEEQQTLAMEEFAEEFGFEVSEIGDVLPNLRDNLTIDEKVISISNLTKENIDVLIEEIYYFIHRADHLCLYTIPYQRYDVINLIHQHFRIMKRDEHPDGIDFRLLINDADQHRLEKMLLRKTPGERPQ